MIKQYICNKEVTKHVYKACLVISLILCITSIILLAHKYASRNKNVGEAEVYPNTIVDCDLKTKDIGEIKSDTTVSFRYVFKNIGTDTLHVIFVKPDCNCTGYQLSSNKAAANDSIVLSIDIDMRNKHKGKFMLNTVVKLNTEQKLYGIRVIGDVI